MSKSNETPTITVIDPAIRHRQQLMAGMATQYDSANEARANARNAKRKTAALLAAGALVTGGAGAIAGDSIIEQPAAKLATTLVLAGAGSMAGGRIVRSAREERLQGQNAREAAIGHTIVARLSGSDETASWALGEFSQTPNEFDDNRPKVVPMLAKNNDVHVKVSGLEGSPDITARVRPTPPRA